MISFQCSFCADDSLPLARSLGNESTHQFSNIPNYSLIVLQSAPHRRQNSRSFSVNCLCVSGTGVVLFDYILLHLVEHTCALVPRTVTLGCTPFTVSLSTSPATCASSRGPLADCTEGANTASASLARLKAPYCQKLHPSEPRRRVHQQCSQPANSARLRLLWSSSQLPVPVVPHSGEQSMSSDSGTHRCQAQRTRQHKTTHYARDSQSPS